MHQMKVRKEVYKLIHRFSPTLDSILLLGCQQLDTVKSADDDNDMIEWKHKDKEKLFTIELDKNDVYNDAYYFYGINDETLQKLRTEMTSTTMPKKAKRCAFEIPGVAVKSMDVSAVIMAGEGISIRKHHFDSANFVIVGFLWSSNESFSVLLIEHGAFSDLDTNAIDMSRGMSITI